MSVCLHFWKLCPHFLVAVLYNLKLTKQNALFKLLLAKSALLGDAYIMNGTPTPKRESKPCLHALAKAVLNCYIYTDLMMCRQ